MTEQQLIDKWIDELTELGYTPEEQIAVFRSAEKKYQQLLTNDAIAIDCEWEEIEPDGLWAYNPAEDMNAPNNL